MNGSFIWDRATSRISSVGKPSIKITHCNFGYNWEKIVSGMKVSSSMSKDRYYAYFSGHFDLRVKFTKYFITWYDIKLGRFTGNIKAYPSIYE